MSLNWGSISYSLVVLVFANMMYLGELSQMGVAYADYSPPPMNNKLCLPAMQSAPGFGNCTYNIFGVNCHSVTTGVGSCGTDSPAVWSAATCMTFSGANCVMKEPTPRSTQNWHSACVDVPPISPCKCVSYPMLPEFNVNVDVTNCGGI